VSAIRWFLVALGCFLIIQLGAIALDDWLWHPPKPFGDGPDYEVIGFNVSEGNGWSHSFADAKWRAPYLKDAHAEYPVQLHRNSPLTPDTNRPPLLPACIGITYLIFPRGPAAFAIVRLGLAACIALGCAIAVAWAHQMAIQTQKANRRVLGVLVCLCMIAIVASERNLRNYATDFLTEPVALALTQLFLVVAWSGIQRGKWTWGIGAGLLFAAMYFCRAVFLLWIPLLLVGFWFALRMASHSPRDSLRWLVAFAVSFMMLCSVWWGRNCYVLESFSPLGTKGSVTMLGGYCDEAYARGGEWQGEPERALRQELEAGLGDSPTSNDFLSLELKMGRLAGQRVKQWATDHASSLPSLFCKRIVTEWNPYTGKALLLKLMALVGIVWLARFHRAALLWLAGPLIINTIVVMFTYSVGGRFLVPTYGELYILSAFGVAGPLSQVKFVTEACSCLLPSKDRESTLTDCTD
jgi:hypothetical protein